MNYEPTPSIEAAPLLEQDAVKTYSAALQKAIRTRDKNEIVELLVARTNRQRQQIRIQYLIDYGRDVIDNLHKELHGTFREVLITMCQPPIECICRQLHDALSDSGWLSSASEKTICELLVPRSNEEISRITDLYERLFERPLIEHICSSTSKQFRCLMTSILMNQRNETYDVSARDARRLAAELFAAGEARRKGTDQIVFNRILSRESFAQLRLVFDEYEQLSGGSTVEEAVAGEMSGDIYEGIISIIECVRYMPGFFAGCLFRALKGWNTDNSALIRVLVTRSEIDLVNIKESYQNIYNRDLRDDIKSQTSGDFKRALVLLLGDKQSSRMNLQ